MFKTAKLYTIYKQIIITDVSHYKTCALCAIYNTIIYIYIFIYIINQGLKTAWSHILLTYKILHIWRSFYMLIVYVIKLS